MFDRYHRLAVKPPIKDMSINANPYQTPDSQRPPANHPEWNGTAQGSARGKLALWLLAYLYPVWLLSSFYLVWLVAWFQLGHRPQPMLDDPKSIGGAMNVLHLIPGILLMLMPILAPLGLTASIIFPVQTRRESRRVTGGALALLYILLCAAVLLTLRWDSAGVVEWWFD